MLGVRGRLTLGVLLVLALALGSAGFVIDRQVSGSEADALDDQLMKTAQLSLATARAAINDALPEDDHRLSAVLSATGYSLQVTLGAGTLYRAGDRPRGTPQRLPNGFSTFDAAGTSYRALALPVDSAHFDGLARIELTASQSDLLARRAERRRWLGAVLAITLLVAGIGTWLAAEVILRPLARLRAAATGIVAERDLAHRVQEDRGPVELRDLGEAFNGMLARLEASAADRERAHAATRRFTADASHELRTPMTSIGATLSLLGRSGLPDADRAELAAEAQEQQRRFVALLDGLSALARGESAPPTLSDVDVDVAELCDELVTALRDGGGVSVHSELPDGATIVHGWEPGLRMLIGNVLRNAVVHGGEPPVVDVRLRRSDDGAVVLTVEDNGPGIAPEDRERVFEPFERAGDSGRPGSGLGLALVAQQAARHHSQVVIEDGERLGGSRFEVSFPASTDPGPGPA